MPGKSKERTRKSTLALLYKRRELKDKANYIFLSLVW
jgi:hypothetical protein